MGNGTDLMVLGKLTSVHGLKGYVKVQSFEDSDSDTLFCAGASVLIRIPHKYEKWHKIIKANAHKKGLLVLLKGINREAAEALVGGELCLKRSDMPELEPGTFYWEDLIGLAVEDVNKGYLGKIDSIIPTGSNDVYVVKDGKSETLVPALPWVVLSVDLTDGKMLVDLPEGL